MAKIPIDRELKVLFLKWLRDGVGELEVSRLRHKYPTTKEEDEQFYRDSNNRLYELGECEIIKMVGKCYPDLEPDYYKKFPYML